ncbi:MAG TPA: serine hydrolase [Ferruginibacter sp.]|nr:serine hydrolase [Ferruginibacter sp.]HRO16917.1 serine hydrolase [Ferruginibacter sp.]HRQ20620.1 serine hydrolase [Ferruginibacter sp.]
MATHAIQQQAFPGCVILIARNGEVVYEKAFGYFTYDSSVKVTTQAVFDVASLTKTLATTLGIMKLFDDGLIKLNQRISHFIPELKHTRSGNITIRNVLTHHAGLPASIPIHKEAVAMMQTGRPVFSSDPALNYSVMVAENLYTDTAWNRRLLKQIAALPAGKMQFRYSDVGFILLGNIIERVSKQGLNEFVKMHFYEPLQLKNTGFNPILNMPVSNIVPTEYDNTFRKQLLQGTVHDPVAAMMGGVAGHAGLFSTAHELFVLMQMLLNKGTFNDFCFIDDKTVNQFTKYQNTSRRGLGFDKPERDNATRKDPYPSALASPATFGHTGFTGTAAWADPESGLIFIFLSNRIHPSATNRKLITMHIRSSIQDAAYRALITEK